VVWWERVGHRIVVCFQVSAEVCLLDVSANVSSARTISDVGRQLGWKSLKTEQDFKNHVLAEARLIIESKSLDWKQLY